MRFFAVMYLPRSYGHPFVSLVRAREVNEAIWMFAQSMYPDLCKCDGGLMDRRTSISYGSAIEFIEREFQVEGEWLIRMLPRRFTQMDVTEAAVAAQPSDLRPMVAKARAQLSLDPPEKPKWFHWMLKEGNLITFFRMDPSLGYQVVGRFLAVGNDPDKVVQWHGTDSHLISQLWLGHEEWIA